MNQEQKKHLSDRLKDACQKKFFGYRNTPKSPAPAAVVSARRVIQRMQIVVRAFERKVNRCHEAHNKRVMKARDKVRQEILFGDPDKALKALERFERRVFK